MSQRPAPVPAPDVPPAAPAPAGTAEAGRCSGSSAVHAVRPGLAGAQAACGAGRILVRVTGRFDPRAPQACAVCAGT